MVTLIWACLLIDLGTVAFLITALFNPDQDAAGKEMVLLPMILLLLLAAIGYFLMQKHQFGWALFVTGFPVIIVIYILIITFT